MSYLKLIEWEIVPANSPPIIKNCSKCGSKSRYINTGNFRVNANGNSIDIWLIYQCYKCKTTYNLPIYERIKSNKIQQDEYKQYLSNDWDKALMCGFDKKLLNKTKAELDYEEINYEIIVRELDKVSNIRNEQRIVIRCPYDLRIRLDKILTQQTGMSRSKIKKLIEDGYIYGMENQNLSKALLSDNLVIGINTIAVSACI